MAIRKLYTDHKPLKKLIEMNIDRKLCYYINCLNEYAYTLKYLPRSKNTVADCLTHVNLRRVLYPTTILIINPPFDLEELKEDELKEKEEDFTSTSNYLVIEENVKIKESLQEEESLPMKEEKEYKDREISKKEELFRNFHDELGHSCYERIYPLAKM
uniref:RNase H domain-containing protein n=1 Tax=Strongyloides venezuelensis TaxID=75913 RepID=A0A0K0FRM2_STRVS